MYKFLVGVGGAWAVGELFGCLVGLGLGGKRQAGPEVVLPHKQVQPLLLWNHTGAARVPHTTCPPILPHLIIAGGWGGGTGGAEEHQEHENQMDWV